MINIQREGTTEGHSVVVQWLPNAAGPGQGRFLINNVTTTGETHPFTKEQFEQGKITVDIKRGDSVQSAKLIRYRIDPNFPAITAHAP